MTGKTILMLGGQLTSLVNFRGPLIRELIAQGDRVVAVAPEPEEPWLTKLKEMGADYHEIKLSRTGLNPFADLGTFIRLVRLIQKIKPDVVFAFQAKAVVYGLPAALCAGVKRRVAMIEGLGQGFGSNRKGWRRKLVCFLVPRLYKTSLKSAQSVIFLNPTDLNDFTTMKIIPAPKAILIDGIGVDLDHFKPQPLPPNTSLHFMMVARLLVEKGVRTYLEAAKEVKKIHPECRFSLYGAEDKSHAGVPLAEVQRQESVVWRYVNDLREALSSCHVFVLPTTYREGLPRSTLEAMATGRAIITTDVPGARETVVDRVNGLLIRPSSVKGLVEAMLYMVDHNTDVQKFGEASLAMARDRFDVRNINRIIISTLRGGV